MYLVRHGETDWSEVGRHTGSVDIPLNERGESNALSLADRIKELTFSRVFTSPLQRAVRTCELAGLGSVAEIDPDLAEWHYGEYEGRLGTDILAERPDWLLYRDGCPDGESAQEVIARADRVVHSLREKRENAILFSSRHLLRVLAARWLGLEPTTISQYLHLSAASLSALGYEFDLKRPAIEFWNDTNHCIA